MKVSISCTTYNHRDFIKETIENFLIQKTNFPFEVLIHDDASTDGTAEIIKAYENQYPELIKAIYQSENQYSKGIPISVTFNWTRAKGKYIAICEGDDYWTDPYKLQKQVDFLEEHPAFGLCGHYSSVYARDWRLPNKLNDYCPTKEILRLRDVLTSTKIHTSSLVFSKEILDIFISYDDKRLVREHPLIIYFASVSKIRVIPEYMSVYRKHLLGVSGNYALDLDGKQSLKYYRINMQAIDALQEIIKGFWLKAQYMRSYYTIKYLLEEKRIPVAKRIKMYSFYFIFSFYNFPYNMKAIFRNFYRIFIKK